LYLFILETIGTQELILVGIIALIVFGPRKLPMMAKKAGGMLRELRSVSNDFKATWAQEVKLEEENATIPEKLDDNEILGSESSGESDTIGSKKEKSILPQVREVSEEDFKKLVASSKKPEIKETTEADKENWL